MTPAADAPAGLVRGDDRRVADLLAEFLVGRRGVAGGAVEQAGETARGDVEVERVAQQVGDLRQRDAHLGVHFDHEADDSGAELYAGRTQRVGGLQGVSALHPPPALRAVPDLDIETPHKGAHLRQFFLILRRHPGHVNRAAAVRTRRRHRRREGLVDLSRARAAALPTVACASPPSGMPAATLRPVLGKGGCLSAAGPPRLVELLLEAFAATLPSVPVAGGARQFTTQPADLAVLLLDALVPRITLAPGRLRTAQSAALASHTARIGTCAPNLHTTSRIFSLLPGKQRPSKVGLFDNSITRSIKGPPRAPRRTSALFATLLPVLMRSNRSNRARSSACSFRTIPRMERLRILRCRESGKSRNVKPWRWLSSSSSPSLRAPETNW